MIIPMPKVNVVNSNKNENKKGEFNMNEETMVAEEIVSVPEVVEEVKDEIMKEEIKEEVVEEVKSEKPHKNRINTRMFIPTEGMIEGYDYVVCHECGRALGSALTKHLTNSHGIEVGRYLVKNPGQRIVPAKMSGRLTREEFIRRGYGAYLTSKYDMVKDSYTTAVRNNDTFKHVNEVAETPLITKEEPKSEMVMATVNGMEEIKQEMISKAFEEIKPVVPTINSNETSAKTKVANNKIEDRLETLISKLNRIHSRYVEKLDWLNYLMDEMEQTYASIFNDKD